MGRPRLSVARLALLLALAAASGSAAPAPDDLARPVEVPAFPANVPLPSPAAEHLVTSPLAVHRNAARQGTPAGIAWDPLGHALVAGEAFVQGSAAAAAVGGKRRLAPESTMHLQAPLKVVEGEASEGDEQAEDHGQEDDEGDGDGGDWDEGDGDGVEGDMLSEEGWLRRRSATPKELRGTRRRSRQMRSRRARG